METQRGAGLNRMRIYLSGGAAQARRETRAVLEALGEPPVEVEDGGFEFAAGPRGRAADVLAVLEDGETGGLDALTRVAAKTPRPPLIAVTADRSAAAIRRIVQAGADELLFAPVDPDEARRVLLKLGAAQERAARGGGGRVISLASLGGGAGVTTLAGNLGVTLRRLLGKQVVLLDLDLQSGALTGFFNLAPERTLAELAGHEHELDSIQLEAALCKHPSGLYLLASPERIEDCEAVTDQTISAVLGLMRQLFDFVIVDCGGRIDENVVAAWERSAEVLYVVEQSVAAARGALRFSQLFGRLGLRNEPAYVLGRYQPRHRITEGQMAQTLGKPMIGRIPRDDRLFERAALRGEDLWTAGRGSAAARAVEALCRSLSGEAGAERRREGWRGWWTDRWPAGRESSPARAGHPPASR